MSKHRPAVTLVTEAKTCEAMLANRAAHYQGFSNSATFTFNLYMMQERPLYEDMCQIVKEAPGVKPTEETYDRAERYMSLAYRARRMEPMDEDAEGMVNVREIVDTLASELRGH